MEKECQENFSLKKNKDCMKDILEISKNTLHRKQFSDPGVSTSEYFVSLSNCSIQKPWSQKLKYGYSRSQDGTVYVVCHIPMPECSGEMFEWWFSFCDNDEKYQLWHPQDHVYGHWCDAYNSIPVGERVRGHHINKSHSVQEYVGGQLQHLRIDFKDPSCYLNVSEFQENEITACLCARVFIKEGPLGYIAVGHMIHIFRESTTEGNHLYSQFWLGDVHSESKLSPLINFIGNTKIFRKIRAPTCLASGLLRHSSEEMACLANFLPALFKKQTTSL